MQVSLFRIVARAAVAREWELVGRLCATTMGNETDPEVPNSGRQAMELIEVVLKGG